METSRHSFHLHSTSFNLPFAAVSNRSSDALFFSKSEDSLSVDESWGTRGRNVWV